MGDNKSFYEIQYESLREEIKESKARIFKIIGFGFAAVPTATIIHQKFPAPIIAFSIPLTIAIVVLVYISESHAIMRCGKFIRFMVEPESKKIFGWETWLSHPDNKSGRSTDNYMFFGMIFLFVIYYLAGCTIAFDAADVEPYKKISIFIKAGYMVVLAGILLFLVKSHQLSTSTNDQEAKSIRDKMMLDRKNLWESTNNEDGVS